MIKDKSATSKQQVSDRDDNSLFASLQALQGENKGNLRNLTRNTRICRNCMKSILECVYVFTININCLANFQSK